MVGGVGLQVFECDSVQNGGGVVEPIGDVGLAVADDRGVDLVISLRAHK